MRHRTGSESIVSPAKDDVCGLKLTMFSLRETPLISITYFQENPLQVTFSTIQFKLNTFKVLLISKGELIMC